MVKITVNAPDQYKLLEPMIYESGRALGFFDADGGLSRMVLDCLYEDEIGDVWLDKFWPRCLCSAEGYNKKEFVNFQVLVYSAKTLYDSGLIDISVEWNGHKMKPCIGKNKPRTGEVIKQIKQAKKIWNIKKYTDNRKLFRQCENTRKTYSPGMIRICCVCFPKPIKILEKCLTN